MFLEAQNGRSFVCDLSSSFTSFNNVMIRCYITRIFSLLCSSLVSVIRSQVEAQNFTFDPIAVCDSIRGRLCVETLRNFQASSHRETFAFLSHPWPVGCKLNIEGSARSITSKQERLTFLFVMREITLRYQQQLDFYLYNSRQTMPRDGSTHSAVCVWLLP